MSTLDPECGMLPPTMHALHRRLKSTFDPAGILNRGRLYPDF